jgi:hypothetical protein
VLLLLLCSLGSGLIIGSDLDLGLLLGSNGLLLSLSLNLGKSLELGKLGLFLCLCLEEVGFHALGFLLGFELGSILVRGKR